MLSITTLASGSSGNCLLVRGGDTSILIDAGISCRRITASLGELGLTPKDLSAILITHTHSDHIYGLQTLLKRTACPICGSGQTCRGLAYRLIGISDRLLELSYGTACSLEGCTVTAFPTSHDAPGACGYRLDALDGSVGILTDTGFVTEEAADILPGVDLAVLESNHDVEALRSGPYPYYLKQRILGSGGHLRNEDAAHFAVALAESGAREIILAHLSRENNTPAMASRAVELALSAAGFSDVRLTVAPRDHMSEAYRVNRRTLCSE